MANFMCSGVSWFIIIVTLTALNSFKTEDDAVLADPGGTAFIRNVVLFVRTAKESEHFDLIILLLLLYVQMGHC
jgi:hypothetical protein